MAPAPTMQAPLQHGQPLTRSPIRASAGVFVVGNDGAVSRMPVRAEDYRPADRSAEDPVPAEDGVIDIRRGQERVSPAVTHRADHPASTSTVRPPSIKPR